MKALLMAWILVSTLFGAVVISSFFPEYTEKATIVVFADNFHTEEKPICFFCGMTRAFYEISNSNFDRARILNRYSLHLYLFFCLNFLSICVVGISKLYVFGSMLINSKGEN